MMYNWWNMLNMATNDDCTKHDFYYDGNAIRMLTDITFKIRHNRKLLNDAKRQSKGI